VNFIDKSLFSASKQFVMTDREIRYEQISLAYTQMPLALITISISSLLLATVQWSVIDHFVIALWLLAQLCVTGWRVYLYRRFLTNFSAQTADEMKKNFFIALTVSSAVFGSASIILFPTGDIPHQVFLSFIMAGMSAGSITTLSSLPRAVPLFLSFALVPLSVVFFLEQSTIHYAMAFMIALFWIMLLVISKRFYDNLYKTLHSGILYRHALSALHFTEERFETIFKQAPIGIFYYDHHYVILEANSEMIKVLSTKKSSLVGLDLNILPDRRIIPAIEAVFSGEEGTYDGSYHSMLTELDLHITLRTSPVYDENRNIIGGVGIVADITERVNYENVVRHLAYHDTLTDIPNRLLLMERIQQAIIRHKRHGMQTALMFIDLDRFKTINDSLGHHIGDELLKDVAERIQHTIREEDTIARVGGDEFVVLISDLDMDIQQATAKVERISEKIHHAISDPFNIEGHTLNITSSIGVAFINNKEEMANDLLKHADAAMYNAKKEGKNTTCYYQMYMDDWIKKRLFLEGELRNAVHNNELELYYQPVVEVVSRKIIGAEALLRWNHPKLGLVMPNDMISIAEESGLIIPIGEWVLRSACEQCVRWKKESPNGDQISKMAVNVSALQFKQGNFIDVVKKVLDETQIDPHLLEIELTESMFIDNLEVTIEKMNELRALGIRMSIDDFGTGYSSLSYLKRLPFNTLKIDRSFVRDIMSDHDDAAMVQTMISMATIFNMDVVAEGVEELDQYEFLRAHACQYFQGYLCSKPVQTDHFEELFNQNAQQY
jgi:diguanylate cyclase (GGDEF)-like protein/PAS domain S-box-containing protein